MDSEANASGVALVEKTTGTNRVSAKVNVSMLSLKWGDVLSMFLPGAVALFAVAPYFPFLWEFVTKLDKAGPAVGAMLIIGAILAGGMLEAVTRVIWEPFWLMWRCKPLDYLSNLTPENLDLYERGVQNSYKYVTFYANFAWATMLLLFGHLHRSPDRFSVGTFVLAIAVIVLLRASHVQWKYYVNYQNKIFGRSNITTC